MATIDALVKEGGSGIKMTYPGHKGWFIPYWKNLATDKWHCRNHEDDHVSMLGEMAKPSEGTFSWVTCYDKWELYVEPEPPKPRVNRKLKEFKK